MFFSDEQLEWAEERIREICPYPQHELAALGTVVGTLPESELAARLRRIALDVDDLCSQARWHLGHAFLILNCCPEIATAGENDPEFIRRLGCHTGALLLLSAYRLGADRVMYNDLSERRSGGTVGGWVFHMLIDGGIHRVISALDRLATLLWAAAELPTKENVYFRSKKLTRIHRAIESTETAALVQLAEDPIFQFLTAYRDRLTHTTKLYTRAAGSLPAESWMNSGEQRVLCGPDPLNANDLFNLARSAHRQFIAALGLVNPVLERRWPISNELQASLSRARHEP
jgi:hypothetical protein